MRSSMVIFTALAAVAFATVAYRETAVGHGSERKPPEASGGHHAGGHGMPRDMKEIRDMHRDHDHGHDFEAMERMSRAQRDRMMAFMHDIGIAMPPMDSKRGRRLFLQKGCIACHSINGVEGDIGPALDAKDMPRPMNAFEFAALMWRGARSMTALQEDLFGEIIAIDGQDLADLVAFAHDEAEQRRLTASQIPKRYRGIIDGD